MITKVRDFALIRIVDCIKLNLAKVDNSRVKTLKDFCAENGAIFITPYNNNTTHILVMNENGHFTLEEIESLGDDAQKHILNHNCIVGECIFLLNGHTLKLLKIYQFLYRNVAQKCGARYAIDSHTIIA